MVRKDCPPAQQRNVLPPLFCIEHPNVWVRTYTNKVEKENHNKERYFSSDLSQISPLNFKKTRKILHV